MYSRSERSINKLLFAKNNQFYDIFDGFIQSALGKKVKSEIEILEGIWNHYAQYGKSAKNASYEVSNKTPSNSEQTILFTRCFTKKIDFHETPLL